MLLLPIFLAAKALAATTYTVTILDENPDQRTLATPASTAYGDVVTYITLYPDGVAPDGQTKYAANPRATAETTVTSILEVPTSTSTIYDTTNTQTLPWYAGHHIEVITTTDVNGTVHEVTRIDEQSTHITVCPTTKSDGKVVLVSSGCYGDPAVGGVTTTTVVAVETPAPPAPIKAVAPVRALPVCNNGEVSWKTVETGCWPVYDMIMPTPMAGNMTKPSPCEHIKSLETVEITVAHIPMKGTTPTDPATYSETVSTSSVTSATTSSAGLHKRGLFNSVGKEFNKRHLPRCAEIHELVDFGTCGNVHVVAQHRKLVNFNSHRRKSWFMTWWWIIPLAILGLALLCLLPCCLLRGRRRREANEKAQQAQQQPEQPVTVVQQPGTVVTNTPNGPVVAGATTTGTGAPATTTGSGAQGTGTGTTGTATGTGTTAAAPTSTAVPAQSVTTTETTNSKETPGTMRRAAEEGRAGQRVRFDGQPESTATTTTAHQVDGTAELRTGSEVFDVGSMRGRKRNRGDEML